MRHHRVVDEHDAHALAVGEPHRLGVGELDAVERPGEPLHVAGQVQFDRPRRLAAVGVVEGAASDPRRSAPAGRCPAGRCPDRRASPTASSSACRPADCPARWRDAPASLPPIADMSCPACGSGAGCAAASGVALVPACGSAAGRGRRVAAWRVRHAGRPALASRGVASIALMSWPMPPCPMSAIVSTGRGSSVGHRRAQSGARRQRAGGEPGAVHGLREDRERVLAGRLDDHVVGLGDRDAELVDGHRPHVLPVGRDDGHLQAGDAHVEVRHRRAVDEPQPHPLARREQPGPVRRPAPARSSGRCRWSR